MDSEKPITAGVPYPLAMIVCDAIWRDPATGKWTLLGCFTGITANAFPCIQPTMAVFISLTDGRGPTPIRLRLVDADEEEEPLIEVETQVEFSDPRMVADMQLHFQGVSFPRAGEYRFQLSSGTTPLLERRIMVLDARRGAS
jgi:hypothetical protein